MNKQSYNIEVTRPNTEGKTVAFVKIFMGPLWLSCRLDGSKGKYYLNPPANFVERLAGTERKGGRIHTGWIPCAGFTPEFMSEVKQKAMHELGLKEQVA